MEDIGMIHIVFIILLIVSEFEVLKILVKKIYGIRKLDKDEVIALSSEKVKKLLRNEEMKRMDLVYAYCKAGRWKGIIYKYYVPEKEKKIEIEKKIKIVENRLKEDDCKDGFILDGFPRNLIQARALEKFAKIDRVILLDVPNEEIERRIAGRRACRDCGEIYNTETYDKTTCAKCGGELYQRDDDKLETVRNRLEVYEKQTAPLIDFYQDKIFRAEGKDTPQETYEPVKIELSLVR